MRKIKQRIFGKNYNILIAISNREKKNGMNIFSSAPKKTGMLFPYREEVPDRSFTLSKTPFSLLVIFLDKNKKIVYHEKANKYQKKPIVCKKPSMFVIEIPV